MPYNCEDKYSTEAINKAALGPAYEHYRNNLDQLKLEWRANKPAFPFLGMSCEDQPLDFMYSSYATTHYILLGIWLGIIITCLTIWWYQENSPLLKIRSFKGALIQAIIITFVYIALTLRLCAGETIYCVLHTTIYFNILPAVVAVLFCKSVQLAFLHNWHQAKASNQLETLRFYHRYKIILSPYMHFVFVFLVLIISYILLSIAVMSSYLDISYYFSTANAFSKLHCYWWIIPEQYTIPTDTTGICNCNPYSATFNQTECYNGISYLCYTNFNSYVDLCTYCYTSPTSAECINELTALLTYKYVDAYECGWPKTTPNFVMCFPCFSASQSSLLTFCSFFILIAAMSVGLLFYIRKMRDHYSLHREATILLSLISVLLILAVIVAQSTATALEFSELLQKYRTVDAIIIFALWVILLLIFVYPVTLAFLKNISFFNNSNTTKKIISQRISSVHQNANFHFSQELVNLTKSDNDQFLTNFKDIDKQYRFIFNNLLATQLFTEFSIKDFTSENVNFLIQMHKLKSTTSQMTQEDLNVEILRIFDTFLSPNAPMELNISSKMLNEIKSFLFDSFNNIIITSKEEFIDVLYPIVDEINKLVIKNTWSRFRCNVRMYSQFIELYEDSCYLDQYFHVQKRLSTVCVDNLAKIRNSNAAEPQSIIKSSTETINPLATSIRSIKIENK